MKRTFAYQTPLFLTKDLCEDNQAKIYRIVKHLNDSLIHLRNSVNNRREIPGKKNREKVFGIVEKFVNFNKPDQRRHSDLAQVARVGKVSDR